MAHPPTSRQIELLTSAAWTGPLPRVAVVVATYNRSGYLDELLAALAEQSLADEHYEVVVVDNGSRPPTWQCLQAAVASTPLRLAVVRLEDNLGAAGARNVGAGLARAPVLAFIDDDCVPTTRWLGALLSGFGPTDAPVHVVQGRVVPQPGAVTRGPWDHTLGVGASTPFFEAANVAYLRSAFDSVGGFAVAWPATPGAPAFGEDAWLGNRVSRLGGARRFEPGAVVQHRWVPRSYGDHVRRQRDFVRFGALAAESETFRASRWRTVFCSADTARADVALVGLAAAVVARRPAWGLLALPWVWHAWPTARARGNGSRALATLRLGQDVAVEAVGLISRLEGSIRHRRWVL